MRLLGGSAEKEQMIHEAMVNPQFLVLSGGGPTLTNSHGVPWTAAYIEANGDLTVDLRSDIAAESRAKIVYERLINLTDDPGVKEALGFLMTREVAHQISFEKALYAMQPNFPPGKLPPDPRFAKTYFDMSQGGMEVRGPWNNEDNFQVVSDREKQAAVDGGDGGSTVKLAAAEKTVVEALKKRTMSDPATDPMTGAELGMGEASAPGTKRTKKT